MKHTQTAKLLGFVCVAAIIGIGLPGSTQSIAGTFKTQIKPAAGVTEVPLYATKAGDVEVDTAPASALNGRFEITGLAKNGMIGIIYHGQKVWVDSFDVDTPELGPKARDCIVLASRMAAPSQSSRGLGDKCKN